LSHNHGFSQRPVSIFATGRVDYGGDINYENGEQTYSDGPEMGQGIVLQFRGFSVQASWEGADRV